MTTWQPIDTAPVEPWDNVPPYYRFRCLLQLKNYTADVSVVEGEAYYIAPPRSKEQRLLRWRSNGRQCFPKYWMPLPAAKD